MFFDYWFIDRKIIIIRIGDNILFTFPEDFINISKVIFRVKFLIFFKRLAVDVELKIFFMFFFKIKFFGNKFSNLFYITVTVSNGIRIFNLRDNFILRQGFDLEYKKKINAFEINITKINLIKKKIIIINMWIFGIFILKNHFIFLRCIFL